MLSTKQCFLLFFYFILLFSYSWSFGILLWEMATMGKIKNIYIFFISINNFSFFMFFFPKLVITFYVTVTIHFNIYLSEIKSCCCCCCYFCQFSLRGTYLYCSEDIFWLNLGVRTWERFLCL